MAPSAELVPTELGRRSHRNHEVGHGLRVQRPRALQSATITNSENGDAAANASRAIADPRSIGPTSALVSSSPARVTSPS